MGVFDRQTATALRLIEKYGQLVQMTKPTVTADPDEPWNQIPGPDETHGVVIAFLPMTNQAREAYRLQKGSDVPTGSELGYMGRVDFVPDGQFSVVRDSARTYRIESVDALEPNGEGVVLYTFILTR